MHIEVTRTCIHKRKDMLDIDVTTPHLSISTVQLVETSRDLTRSGAPQGVSQRDRAAIHIDLFCVKLQLSNAVHIHRSKSLVDLSSPF